MMVLLLLLLLPCSAQMGLLQMRRHAERALLLLLLLLLLRLLLHFLGSGCQRLTSLDDLHDLWVCQPPSPAAPRQCTASIHVRQTPLRALIVGCSAAMYACDSEQLPRLLWQVLRVATASTLGLHRGVGRPCSPGAGLLQQLLVELRGAGRQIVEHPRVLQHLAHGATLGRVGGQHARDEVHHKGRPLRATGTVVRAARCELPTDHQRHWMIP